MRSLVLVVACLLAGCGDNLLGDGLPLTTAHDLVIVAHEDDDLIFMQPDVVEAVQSGEGVTLRYVTAGNNRSGPEAADKRYDGLLAAYGTAAGDQDWLCGWIRIYGHLLEHCRLEAERVSLIFLGYPDGGKEGQYDDS